MPCFFGPSPPEYHEEKKEQINRYYKQKLNKICLLDFRTFQVSFFLESWFWETSSLTYFQWFKAGFANVPSSFFGKVGLKIPEKVYMQSGARHRRWRRGGEGGNAQAGFPHNLVIRFFFNI
jgi:hypothetical protein